MKLNGLCELCDGLHSIKLQITHSSMHLSIGLKQCFVYENSSMLWNQRLNISPLRESID